MIFKILVAIFFLGLFILGCFTIYWATIYWELHDVIKKCDKDFGAGNWSFTQTHDAYICHSYKSYSYVTSTVTSSTSKQCFENGQEVNCG